LAHCKSANLLLGQSQDLSSHPQFSPLDARDPHPHLPIASQPAGVPLCVHCKPGTPFPTRLVGSLSLLQTLPDSWVIGSGFWLLRCSWGPHRGLSAPCVQVPGVGDIAVSEVHGGRWCALIKEPAPAFCTHVFHHPASLIWKGQTGSPPTQPPAWYELGFCGPELGTG
jgi:hypothetical protein